MDIRAIKQKIQKLQKALLKSIYCKTAPRVTSSKYLTIKTEKLHPERILSIITQMHRPQ
jgi:hypothetical protein